MRVNQNITKCLIYPYRSDSSFWKKLKDRTRTRSFMTIKITKRTIKSTSIDGSLPTNVVSSDHSSLTQRRMQTTSSVTRFPTHLSLMIMTTSRSRLSSFLFLSILSHSFERAFGLVIAPDSFAAPPPSCRRDDSNRHFGDKTPRLNPSLTIIYLSPRNKELRRPAFLLHYRAVLPNLFVKYLSCINSFVIYLIECCELHEPYLLSQFKGSCKVCYDSSGNPSINRFISMSDSILPPISL